MTSTAQPLVGRTTEFQLLDRLLEEACDGDCRFVALSGEPGIGKSSVLAELSRRAERRGCLVLNGRATELERELPFGLLIDAFDAHLESLDPHVYERLAADDLGELAAVFPALRSLRSESAPPETAAERFRAHHAVRELVERLAAGRPVVLVLDDVHWTDGATLELLRHLLRRPPEASALIAVAYRSGPEAPLLGVEGDAAVTELRLGPLGPRDAEQLVDAEGAAQLEQLYRESGGNPFYLLQLARTGGIPQPVTAAIRMELRQLPDAARAFAQAASVTGDPFELDVAAAAADVPEAVALDALDELIVRDVVRPGDAPRWFRFRHPLVRTAIYESSPGGSRLAAHQRTAEELARRGAPATARAHHVEQCARHGDTEAIAVLREAGEEAAHRAPASAARWYAAALRILPPNAPPADRAALLMPLAAAKAATGHLEEARAALLETLDLARVEPSLPRVSLISACASIEHLLGRHDAARDRLASALDDLSDSPEGAALMGDLAMTAFFAMEFDRMRDWAAAALEVVEPHGDRPATAAATALLSLAESCTGPIPSSAAHADAAKALLDAMPDDVAAQRLDAFGHLSGAEFYLERFEDSERHARRGLALARATAQGDFWPMMIAALGNVLFVTGRTDEAITILDDATDSARVSDNATSLAWSLLNRAHAAVIAGDVDTGLRLGDEAVALCGDLSGSAIGTWAGAAAGFALLEKGDAAAARDMLLASGGGPAGANVAGAWRSNWLEWMTRCRLALGEQDEAATAARLALERAEEFGLANGRASAERALAAVALAAGDARGAAEGAVRAAELAAGAGVPAEAAHGRTLAGRAFAAAGDTKRAAVELEAAAAAFDALGAVRYRDRAERELRALGHAIHRRTRPGDQDAQGVEALTGRELEIARLVVDRRTNPEIASALFLSIKTVESHLRNIFRKLGASSRVEVARIVERSDPR